jgi:hypothetical protein
MKKSLLLAVFTVCSLMVGAQEYNVTSAGTAKDGSYLAKVKVSIKKLKKVTAEDLVLRYAVEAVMFNGLNDANGYNTQKPLIKDADARQKNGEFFEAFNNEGRFRQFATVVNSSLTSMKNKQTKMIDNEATVIVKKEELQHYLEERGIIKGFSNLW